MLWPRRRRALAVAHVLCCLALVPTFVAIAWNVGDGPRILNLFALSSPFPAGNLKDSGFVIVSLGLLIGAFRSGRLIYDLRERALTGDVDAVPRAKRMEASDSPPIQLSIMLVWTNTWESRLRMALGFAVSLAALVGLVILMSATGLFDALSSLSGGLFWALAGEIVTITLLLMLIPLAFLRAATRGPRGVVADDMGVSAWSRTGPRATILWADARLLEVSTGGRRGKRVPRMATLYTLYAADGRALKWFTYPESSRSLKLVGADVNDSFARADAISALAERHAGLAPRTFVTTLADTSRQSSTDGSLLESLYLAGAFVGNFAGMLAATAGCGVATLLYPTPLPPLVAPLCVAILSIASLWSLADALAEELTLPRRLGPKERPDWSGRASSYGDNRPVAMHQRRRPRSWGSLARVALFLIGSGACLVIIAVSLASGYPVGDGLATFGVVAWLVCVLSFNALIVLFGGRVERLLLVADAAGLRDLSTPQERVYAWEAIESLRFTWSRRAGITYILTLEDGRDLIWRSDALRWRATGADSLPEFVGATDVDGETFAAIISARTGLLLTQALMP